MDYATCELAERINNALSVIVRSGMVDGAHHKQWVLDQVVRALLNGQNYDAWVAEYNSLNDYEDWDTGIAP